MLKLANLRGFDVETPLIVAGKSAPPIVLAGVAGGSEAPRALMRPEFLDWLRQHLENPDIVFANHNMAFDFSCVVENHPEFTESVYKAYAEDRVICTILLTKLYDLATRGYASGLKQLGLDALMQRFFDRKLDKDTWRLRYAEFEGMTLDQVPEGARKYAVTDVVATLALFLKLLQKAKAGRGVPLNDVYAQSRASFALHRMSAGGLITDLYYTSRLKKWAVEERDRVEKLLLSEGLIYEGVRCPKTNPTLTGKVHMAKKKALAYAEAFERANQFEFERTPSGQISLGEDSVAGCGDQVLEAFAFWSRSVQILNEVDRLEAGAYGEPINPSYDALKNTGRTSSGGGEAKLNIQNRRREFGFRECFIPRPGKVFCAIDYGALELHTLAQVCLELFRESKLAETINSGQDPHLRTVCYLTRKTYADVEKLHKEGDSTIKDLRQLGKALSFGLPGGLAEIKFRTFAKKTYGVDVLPSDWSFVSQEGYIEVPWEYRPRTLFATAVPADKLAWAKTQRLFMADKYRDAVYQRDGDPPGVWRVYSRAFEEAGHSFYVKENTFAHLRMVWLQGYPEMLRYFQEVKKWEVERTDEGSLYRVVQLFSKRVRNRATYNAALNSMFQGLAADGAKAVVFELMRQYEADPSSPLYGRCRPAAFIHDEVLFEVDIEHAHECAHHAAEVMREVMDKWTPGCPNVAEPALCRRWTKSAEAPRYDAAGRLIPEEDYRLAVGYEQMRARGKDVDDEAKDVRMFFERHGLEVLGQWS